MSWIMKEGERTRIRRTSIGMQNTVLVSWFLSAWDCGNFLTVQGKKKTKPTTKNADQNND